MVQIWSSTHIDYQSSGKTRQFVTHVHCFISISISISIPIYRILITHTRTCLPQSINKHLVRHRRSLNCGGIIVHPLEYLEAPVRHTRGVVLLYYYLFCFYIVVLCCCEGDISNSTMLYDSDIEYYRIQYKNTGIGSPMNHSTR